MAVHRVGNTLLVDNFRADHVEVGMQGSKFKGLVDSGELPQVGNVLRLFYLSLLWTHVSTYIRLIFVSGFTLSPLECEELLASCFDFWLHVVCTLILNVL